MANNEPLKLHIATSVEASGLDRATEGIKQAEQATVSLSSAAGQVAAAHGKMDGEMGKATKTSNGFGAAALQAAYAADDLQYGLKGIVNNIPGLVLSMGMGGGVAGVVSIAAVALNVLSNQMDKTAKESENLTLKAGQATQKAKEEAAEHKATADSLKQHEDRVKALADGYKDLVAQIDAAARAREVMVRNMLAETNAAAALELAHIENARANGKISDQDAEARSLAVKAGAEKKQFQMEQEQALKREADLAAKAAGARGEASGKGTEAENLAAKGQGLLTSGEREVARARVKEAAEVRKKAEKELEDTPENTVKYVMSREGYYAETIANPAYAKAQDKVAQANQRVSQTRSILDRDNEAKQRSGITSQEDLKKEVERLQREATELRKAALTAQREAEQSMATRQSQAKIYGLTSQQAELESSTKISGFDKRDEAAFQKAEEAKAKKTGKGIGAEGRDVLADLKRAVVPEEGMAQLRDALEATAAGSEEGRNQLKTLLSQVARYLVKTNQVTDTLKRDFEELRTQLSESRNGR